MAEKYTWRMQINRFAAVFENAKAYSVCDCFLLCIEYRNYMYVYLLNWNAIFMRMENLVTGQYG